MPTPDDCTGDSGVRPPEPVFLLQQHFVTYMPQRNITVT